MRDEQHKVQELANDFMLKNQCSLGFADDKFCNTKVNVFKKVVEVDYQLPKPYPVTTNQVYGRLPRYYCDKHELYKF